MDSKDLKSILSDFVSDQFIKDNFKKYSTVDEFVMAVENNFLRFIKSESNGKFDSLESLLASAAVDSVFDEIEI